MCWASLFRYDPNHTGDFHPAHICQRQVISKLLRAGKGQAARGNYIFKALPLKALEINNMQNGNMQLKFSGD